MGLFKKAPIAPPAVHRQDLQQAISNAPRKEMEYLQHRQFHFDYLEKGLPADEKILIAGTCDYARQDPNAGLMAVTPKRVIAIISKHDGSQPAVYAFPIKDLTFSAREMPYADHLLATFDVPGKPTSELFIGHDINWAHAVADEVTQQLNRSRLG